MTSALDQAQWFELLAIPLAIILGGLDGAFAAERCLASRRAWGRLGQRRGLSVVLVGLTSLAVCLLVATAKGLPVPTFHDEFCYLLAADTFAHGRLTNPTHPLWVYFESFHIIQQPTYMAKYPPGQGLFLAVGQVVCGQPIAGVWLSIALACAATCWMLQGWLPPRWALLGGLLAALQARIVYDWGETYWGGAVPMLGGALLFGALCRLLRRPCWPTSLVMGLGLALLALSRPFEGMVASLPAAAVLIAWLLGRQRPGWGKALRVVLPTALVLAGTGAFIGYYNYRVTGDPLRLPYVVHEEQYVVAPIFFWQPLRPMPEYHHAVLRQFYTTWHLEQYNWHHLPGSLLSALSVKALWLWRFFLQVTLGIPLVTLPWMLRNRWARFALLDILLVVGAVLQVACISPHYAAPITGLAFYLVVQGLRQLRAGRRRWPSLQPLVPSLLLIFLATSVLTLVLMGRADPEAWPRERAALQARLQESGAKHLVIVHYSDRHLGYQEWVYNSADIDGSPVVWARAMNSAADQELLSYFRDRTVWLLEADDQPPVLRPYRAPLQ